MKLQTTIARFRTRCAVCDDMIEEDELIVHLPYDEEAVHVDCAIEEGFDVE